MGFKIVKDDETNEKFIHFFNSHDVFMARVPLPEGFEKLSEAEKLDYLRTHHGSILNRIR